MRSLDKILGHRYKPPEKEDETGPLPPVIRAERAEEARFEEAKEKDEIISRYRKRTGDIK